MQQEAYNHKTIEKKWQKYWDEHQTFKTDVWDFSKPKYYVLDMFPYFRRRSSCRTSGRIYGNRYYVKNEKNAGLQCASPDGL